MLTLNLCDKGSTGGVSLLENLSLVTYRLVRYILSGPFGYSESK